MSCGVHFSAWNTQSGLSPLIHAIASIDAFHHRAVDEDQRHENKDRALLRPPETEFESEQGDPIEGLHQQNAEPEGHQEPDDEQHAASLRLARQ